MRRLALILAVGIVPLVVYNAADMQPAAEFARFTGGSFVTDMWFLAKARVVFIAGLLAALSLPLWRAYPMALMGLLLLSAGLAGHPVVVARGSPWHYEGVAVLASYLALFAAASSGDHRRVVFRALAVSSLVVTAMAAMEYFGKPYALVMPDWALGLDGMPVDHGKPRGVSGPFGNSNHLGMYAAMVGPLMLGLGRWYLIPAMGMAFCIAASGSRGAMVGAVAGLIMLAFRGRRV